MCRVGLDFLDAVRVFVVVVTSPVWSIVVRYRCGTLRGARVRMSPDQNLLHADLTHIILGGFYDVYNQLGPGFLESVYEAALEIELRWALVDVKRQSDVPVFFKGYLVGRFVADLLVQGKVVVELKSVRKLAPIHDAQLMNLLKATRLEVGLLVNFGYQPQVKRMVYSNSGKQLGPADYQVRSTGSFDDESLPKGYGPGS